MGTKALHAETVTWVQESVWGEELDSRNVRTPAPQTSITSHVFLHLPQKHENTYFLFVCLLV